MENVYWEHLDEAEWRFSEADPRGGKEERKKFWSHVTNGFYRGISLVVRIFRNIQNILTACGSLSGSMENYTTVKVEISRYQLLLKCVPAQRGCICYLAHLSSRSVGEQWK